MATRGISVDSLGRVTLNPTGPGSQNDQSYTVNAANGSMLQRLTCRQSRGQFLALLRHKAEHAHALDLHTTESASADDPYLASSAP